MRSCEDPLDRLRCHIAYFLLGALISTLLLGFLYYRAQQSGYLVVKKEQDTIRMTIGTLRIKEVEAFNKAIRAYQADLEALFKVPVYDMKNPKTGELNEK